MVYTLLPLSCKGIQIFLSMDMYMDTYSNNPCAEEEKT